MGVLSKIRNRYNSFARYNQILKVLIKYGFEDLVFYMKQEKRYQFLQRFVPKSAKKHALEHTKWERMRLVCEELGPTFVKFGQIMSNRPDLIPFDLVFELEKLQNNVPPMPEKQAKEIVESQLMDKVENLFSWFETKPFASASMAQVHKVILHTGERIVLKIQRPGIHDIIFEDIKVMYKIASVLEKRIPGLKSFDPIGLVKNFEQSIFKELDFINESINVQRFYNNIMEDKHKDQFARAPKVYQSYTTDKILALEYISGIKINKLEELADNGFQQEVIGTRLAKTYFKQIFEYGFFHADPHPGNLLVMPNGQICYLDFGMMGSILPRDIQVFGHLFIAIIKKDVKKIISALQKLSSNSAVENMRDLEFDINEFVEKHYVRTIHKNEMSTVLMELKDIIVAHGLKVPSYFYLFARSLVTIEGVIEKLNPDLDQFELVSPYLHKSVSKRYNPIKMGEKMLNSLYELSNYMEEFPGDLKNAIQKINSGQVKVDLTHKGIDPMVHTLQRVTKQLVSAFIAIALLIGSTLFILYDVKPLWRDTSIFGIIGIIIALFLVFGMLNNFKKGDYDNS